MKNHLVLCNKRGNAIIDTLTIAVIIFAMGIVSIVAYQFFDVANTEIQDSDLFDNSTKNISNNTYNIFPTLVDDIFLFSLGLLMIGTVVAAFYIDTHPVFLMATLVLLIGVFVAVMMLANVYDDIASDSELSSYAADLTFTNWVMNNYLTVFIGVGILITIALYIKLRG